ncbi:hypothetical protein ACOMHN_036026 [Nucella lapillus]
MAEVVISGVNSLSQVELTSPQQTFLLCLQPPAAQYVETQVPGRAPSFSVSQLESIIPPPPSPALFPQIQGEASSAAGYLDQKVPPPVRQSLHPQPENLSSVQQSSVRQSLHPQPENLSSDQQSSVQQLSPHHQAASSPSTGGQGFPPFSQPQFPPRPGMLPVLSHPHRLSPIDLAALPAVPQFPRPGGHLFSPGKSLTDKKLYRCSECDKVFRSQQALSYHRNAKHSCRDDLKCPLCGRMLGHKQHKNYHMKHVHNVDASIIL